MAFLFTKSYCLSNCRKSYLSIHKNIGDSNPLHYFSGMGKYSDFLPYVMYTLTSRIES